MWLSCCTSKVTWRLWSKADPWVQDSCGVKSFILQQDQNLCIWVTCSTCAVPGHTFTCSCSFRHSEMEAGGDALAATTLAPRYQGIQVVVVLCNTNISAFQQCSGSVRCKNPHFYLKNKSKRACALSFRGWNHWR